MPFANPEERREYDREWAKTHRSQINARRRTSAPINGQRLKDRCFQAYGGYYCSCSNCPETNPKLMTLDHIHGDGKKHRRESGSRLKGYGLYQWIIKNNFPPMFQVLCWNCNSGRALNGGICPHHTFTSTDKLLFCQLQVFRITCLSEPLAL